MKNIFKKLKSGVRGFSIIELLIVLAIIGILTAIMTTNFAQSKAKARDAKRVSDIAQIQLALELFFDRCNAYPDTLDTTKTCPTNSAIVFGNYISKIPTDTYSNVSYDYVLNTAFTDYVLRATLETPNSTALQDDIDNDKLPSWTTSSVIDCDDSPDIHFCLRPN